MPLAVAVVLMFAGPLDEPPTASTYVLVDATLNRRAVVGTRVLALDNEARWIVIAPTRTA